jgi:hypothetical protein
MSDKSGTNYEIHIEAVFKRHFDPKKARIPFRRTEIDEVSSELGLKRIKNLGDLVYTYRYRSELPKSIQETARPGCEWIIIGSGRGTYEFRLANVGKVEATSNRLEIKIPDATPEILSMYAPGTDEQALLTKVRYNRLLDVFTGLTCYSIQNHFRTTVEGIGQIEVDEVYVGISSSGTHYVLPCQAKSPGDAFGVAQIHQDMSLCAKQYPMAICRPIAIQFGDSDSIAMMEMVVREDDEVFSLKVAHEKHYKLVFNDEISDTDLSAYSSSGDSL